MTKIAKKTLVLASLGLATALASGMLATSANAAEREAPRTGSSASSKAVPGIAYSRGEVVATMTKNQTRLLGNALDAAEFVAGDLTAAATLLCDAVPIPFGPAVCSYLVNRSLGSWIPEIKAAASDNMCVQVTATAYVPIPAFWRVTNVYC